MTHDGSKRHRFEASAGDAGQRLDQVLAARIPELSRRQARVLIDIGGVFVDRARVKVAGRKLKAGQVVETTIGGALARATKKLGAAARAQDAAALPDYRIVFEDDDLVVVDKPPGLLVAPTPESDRGNLADLLARRSEPALAIWVVHRIDLQTSGVLVFAKTVAANRALSQRFRVHDMDRAYLAVVEGAMAEPGAPVSVQVAGKRAVTRFTVVARAGQRATLLRAELETGRTHQIRLHAKHLGHHVLGDPQYAAKTDHDPPRMALHATRLGFKHPRTGAALLFESELPDDIATWWNELRQASETTQQEHLP